MLSIIQTSVKLVTERAERKHDMGAVRQCHSNAIVTGVILSTTFLGLCMAEEPAMQVTRDLYTGQIVITEEIIGSQRGGVPSRFSIACSDSGCPGSQ